MRTLHTIVTAVAVLAAWAAAGPEEDGVAVTAYNGGYGVVREIRSLEITPDGQVQFKDVAGQIDPTSVHFRSLTDPAAKLLEQSFQYDLVSGQKLLEKSVDRTVELACKDTKTASGKLLCFDDTTLVLEEAQGVVAMIPRDEVQHIRFPVQPGGLLTRPTLVWRVRTDKPGRQQVELAYQTTGIAWHAEYVLTVGEGDTTADLSGWVSVKNSSGKTYHDAKLKFVGGDVKKLREPDENESSSNGLFGGGARGSEQEMKAKPFFEYHMYTLARRSTVADNEIKQLELFPPVRGVKVEKRYLFNPMGGVRWYDSDAQRDSTYGPGAGEKKVSVFVELVNSKANNLGMSLPAGKVRVYKQDADDKAQEFIGEERIDHTPREEKLSLQIGNAFDIVGERRSTKFETDAGRRWTQESVEIRLRNHKAEPVTIRCKEPMYRWENWKITQKSDEFLSLDAHTAAFDVKVEPEKEKVVTYTVEYTW